MDDQPTNSDLQQEIRGMAARLGNVERDVRDCVKMVAQSMTYVGECFAGVDDGRFAGIDGRLADIDRRFAEVRHDMNRRFDGVDFHFDRLEKQMQTELTVTRGEMRAGFAEMREEFRKLTPVKKTTRRTAAGLNSSALLRSCASA